MRQRVNVRDQKTGKRRTGVLNPITGEVKTSDGRTQSLKSYEDKDENGVGFFETRHKGKLIQKVGKLDA